MMQRQLRLMGNAFTLMADTSDATLGQAALEAAIAEMQRIEARFTTFDEGSETQLINRMAGISPVKVSAEMLALVQRSLYLSRLTQGAFDLSYGSLDRRFWNFDRGMTQLPDRRKARQAVRLINYQHIQVNEARSEIYLARQGMRIGFGGIGKGYAADQAAQVMQEMGVARGCISAAGDLYCWGAAAQPWRVALEVPETVQQHLGHLDLTNYAVATSGDYEKAVTIDGVRYSHTIDPRTGFPARAMRSVTVIAPKAELADALCTPLMIMGPEVGLHLIDQLPHVEAVIIDPHNQLHVSQRIHLSHV
ncbi:MAG: FAD:protein FMN transferase [Bacteroidota bacterium]